MKRFWWLASLVCALFFTSYKPAAYGTGVEIEDVVGALKSGNANQLSRYFDTRVDITLPEKSDNYSRAQAEMIIRDFFSNNSVQNFEIKYKGDNNGSRFCIGTLKTRNGDYRTRLYMKQRDNRQVLQEIAFQNAD
jgi:hypothetical protein